jgi:hypothetical protein
VTVSNPLKLTMFGQCVNSKYSISDIELICENSQIGVWLRLKYPMELVFVRLGKLTIDVPSKLSFLIFSG